MIVRPSLAAAALLAAGVLTACASSTAGTPHGTAPSTPTPSSTPRQPATHSPTPTSPPPSSSASTSASSSTHPVPAQPLRSKVVIASDGSSYPISVWAEQHSQDCAAHAYGAVAEYLAAHQCLGVEQILATTTIDGQAVGFAQNIVGFGGGMNASYRAAGNFRTLVTQNGTGNLDDLLREGYRLPAGPDHVPSPDAFQALGQDAGVVVTDAWFLDHPTQENDHRLLKFAKDIFLQI